MPWSLVRLFVRPLSTRSALDKRAIRLQRLRQAARTLQAVGDIAPVPYIKGVASMALQLIEAIQRSEENIEGLNEVIQGIVSVILVVGDLVEHHAATSPEIEEICLDFKRSLSEILLRIMRLTEKTQGRHSVTRILVADEVSSLLERHKRELEKIQQQLALRLAITTGFRISSVEANVAEISQALLAKSNYLKPRICLDRPEHCCVEYQKVRCEDDYTILRLGDIILEAEQCCLHLKYSEDSDSDRTLIQSVPIQEYTGRVGAKSGMVIRKYDGVGSTSEWAQDRAVFETLRHPNILQLYGLCLSPRFQALIFHGGPRSLIFNHHKTLTGVDFLKFPLDIIKQFSSADRALKELSLKPFPNYWHSVDTQGNLLLGQFSPTKTLFVPRSWPILAEAEAMLDDFRTGVFVRSRLVQYYQFLSILSSPMVSYSTFRPASLDENIGVCVMNRGTQTPLYTLSRNALNLNLACHFNSDIELKLLPGMTIRCRVPVSNIRTLALFEELDIGFKTDLPALNGLSGFQSLFCISTSQMNHHLQKIGIDPTLTHIGIPAAMRFSCRSSKVNVLAPSTNKVSAIPDVLYLFCQPSSPATVKCATYWSADADGCDVVSASDISDQFGISIIANIWIEYFRIPVNLYPILRQMDRGCGFEEASLEVVEYLGLPVMEAVYGVEPRPLFQCVSETHGFFFSMGGFVSCDDGHPITSQSQLFGSSANRQFRADIKVVDVKDIEDKNIGDAIAKGIVILQDLWFITQCILRKTQRQTVTPLEVATLAYLGNTVFIWYLWWNKPLDVD
ncbi:hypothetical protein C8J56DRAFT_1169085 [Mycena floridula]|nr:hypothetical protein C8J56DRAFT_1169085 [Mycena floridula]